MWCNPFNRDEGMRGVLEGVCVDIREGAGRVGGKGVSKEGVKRNLGRERGEEDGGEGGGLMCVGGALTGSVFYFHPTFPGGKKGVLFGWVRE